MATVRRCPVCRGTLTGMWGESAAPNRRYCSAACRQQAYRERTTTTPAERRRAAAARRAAVDAAVVDVDRVLAETADQVRQMQAAVDRRGSRLSWQVAELAATVELLAAAILDYDRVGGATWTDLAGGAGSTSRPCAAGSAAAPPSPPKLGSPTRVQRVLSVSVDHDRRGGL